MVNKEQIIKKWRRYCNKHWAGNTKDKKIILEVDEDFGEEFLNELMNKEELRK